MLNYFPKYFTDKAIYLYAALLIIVFFLFMSHVMSWYWFVFGLIAVICFFYFSNNLTKKWANVTEKTFTKKLFITALIIRVCWVTFSYFFYIQMTGAPFEFHAADAGMYDSVANALSSGGLSNYESTMYGLGLSDRGYPTYLGVLYMLTGKSIFIARLIKAVLSAFTCVLIYRLAKRNFGEAAGRMAAIFCLLMPNLIFYCGLHLKEIEMVFLTVAFIERADYAMRSTKFKITNLILPIAIAGSLFFFRTVLGATALFAFITALIFSNKKALKKSWNRILMIVWVILAIGYFMGGRIATEVEEVWENRADNQQNSMQFRAEREGGNEFAKYASGAVFAPMIFVIPFPTIVNVQDQENQQFINGGNYVKNIMAFFTIFALFWVIKNRKWRDFTLIGAFTFGYLIVIAFSAFAQSERFHQPALPFVLTMAAYGVSKVTNKTKKYYMIYLGLIAVAIIGWSWFKLAGRGLV